MSERSWFTAFDGKQEGPFPESQIGSLIGAGRITRDTLVWADGMTDWQRAGDVPGFVFSARAPAPPPLSPSFRLPGGPPANDLDMAVGGQVASDFGVWALFGRVLLLIVGTLLVIPAPWVFTAFYRWIIPHIQVPQRPNLAFTGKVGDIWWVFILYALCSYAGLAHVRYLPFLLFPLQLALAWLILRWVLANISSEGRPLALGFGGSVAGYIGWNLFLEISIISIIGWAWVETAWMRWIARNITGTARPVFFNATGLEVLWRTIVVVLASIFVIPIPWMIHWYARWFLSQFSVGKEML
ncbi:MAG TPA: DUF4339 domain-containing protein [Methylovirgula sp.]